jgi:hypothetical protein
MKENPFDVLEDETDAFLDDLALATVLGTLTNNPLAPFLNEAGVMIDKYLVLADHYRTALGAAIDKLVEVSDPDDETIKTLSEVAKDL